MFALNSVCKELFHSVDEEQPLKGIFSVKPSSPNGNIKGYWRGK